jgi:hypothetical protein
MPHANLTMVKDERRLVLLLAHPGHWQIGSHQFGGRWQPSKSVKIPISLSKAYMKGGWVDIPIGNSKLTSEGLACPKNH